MQDAKTVLPLWGKQLSVENSKTKKILGINFIDCKTSILDMVVTLIETGYLPNKLDNKKK